MKKLIHLGVTIESVLLKDGDMSGNDASFNNI